MVKQMSRLRLPCTPPSSSWLPTSTSLGTLLRSREVSMMSVAARRAWLAVNGKFLRAIEENLGRDE